MSVLEHFRSLSRTKQLLLATSIIATGGALAYWLHYRQTYSDVDLPLKLKKKVKRQEREIILVSHRVDWTRAYNYIVAALDECKVCNNFFIYSILKVGVGAVEDGKKLLKDYGIKVQGCVDLRNMVVRQGKKYMGGLSLRAIAHDVLEVDLEKSQSIRCGNWEAAELSDEQIQYAADDACYAMDIFTTIVANKLSHTSILDQLLDYYAHPYAEDLDDGDVIIAEFNKKAQSLCQGIVDVTFKQTSGSQSLRVSDLLVVSFCAPTLPEEMPSSRNKSQNARPDDSSRGVSYKSYTTRKSPLYHNCQLRAPDGQLLCTCDEKKAEWYLYKGLGKKISDNPVTVQLNFEPGGRPESLKNYYLQEKQNACVVCGQSDSYLRKNVVPHEYRKYFPSIMKDHLSHDVLLLCIPCHRVSSCHDNAMREHFAEQCDAPIHRGSNIKSFSDPLLKKIQSSARALMQTKRMLPEERRHELEENIKNFFGVDEIDEEVLQRANDVDTTVINEDYYPHGEKVVDYMVHHGKLMEFEKQWRQNFLSTMKPQHLPPYWSVDHNHERLTNMEMKV